MLAKGPNRSRILTAVKYVLGLGALTWVLKTADVNQIINALDQFSGLTIAAVIAISAVNMLAHTATWYPFVNHFETPKFDQLLYADLVIKFVNSLFPSRLSGRLAAPAALRHFVGFPWSEAVAVSIAHTGLYALLYGSFTLLGFLFSVDIYSPGLALVILLSTSMYLTVGVAVVLAGLRLDLFERLITRIVDLLGSVPGGRLVASPLDGFRITLLDGSEFEFQSLLRNRREIGSYGLLWAVAVMVLPATRMWILLSASGVSGFDFIILPFYVIVAYSVTILPLTPSGIGVAEATAVAVFVALGLPEATVVSIVLLDRVFGVYLPSLLGWGPLVRSNLEGIVK